MIKNYQFTQNRKCEYFPCHRVENNDDFNCLFCYCPLYMLKGKCGGNFKYTNGFKDCSECLIPHTKDSHSYMMTKMPLVLDIGSERE